MNHVDLFSGIGGFALAAGWAGFTTVGFCEIEPFCREVITARFGAIADTEPVRELQPQGGERNERGRIGNGPVLYSDIRSLDGSRFRNITLLTGGFPCQPFSVAGKRKGKDDDRHLWPEMLRVIHEARPRWVIGENVAGFVSMALDEVCADLEGEGYEVQPFVIPACAVNAPHRRDRVWIVGHSSSHRCEWGRQGNAAAKGLQPRSKHAGELEGRLEGSYRHAPDTEGMRLGGWSVDGCQVEREGFLSGEQDWGQVGGENEGCHRVISPGWDASWTEIAQRFCSLDARLSDNLVGRPLRDKNRVQRLKAAGNSIVPQVAYEIIQAIAQIERGEIT